MNIKKYIDNTTQISEGVCYKNEDAFHDEENAICYVSEYQLADLVQMLKNGSKDMTDEQMVQYGYADTRATIIKKVKKNWEYLNEEIIADCSVEEVAAQVFNNAEWATIDTEIDQLCY